MENNNIWSKLDYIRDLNTRRASNCKNTRGSLEEHTDNEVQANFKVIQECFSFSLAKVKNQSNKEIEIEKIEVLKKKLNIAKGYLYLVFFTLSLKYLDIIIRVKYGGMIIAKKSNYYRNNFLFRILLHFLFLE